MRNSARVPQELIDAVLNRVKPSDVIGRTVKLSRRGAEHVGLCPFHNEKTPSFHVIDAKGFFHCFGCGANGNAIEFVRRIGGLSFRAAVEQLDSGAALPRGTQVEKVIQPARKAADDHHRREELMRAILRESVRAVGTLTEIYLQSRAITLPLPPTLRHVPRLRHGPTGLYFPALVSLLQQPDGSVTGVQRTYLSADGRGKAPVESPKRSFGEFGSGAVRLSPPKAVLGICEGIESSLSAMQLHRVGVWCTLGSQRLSRVWLPPVVRRVVIFADADATGRREAEVASIEFCRQGREAEIRFPRIGADFNDELQARGAAE